METKQEILIPEAFIEMLLERAAELDLSVEELIERALRNYLKEAEAEHAE